jgi:hypothetical protein
VTKPETPPIVIPSKTHAPIQREWLDSSAVSSFGYDPAAKVLQVGFCSRGHRGEPPIRDVRIYDYTNISEEFYAELMAQQEKSHFIIHNLVYSNTPFTMVFRADN